MFDFGLDRYIEIHVSRIFFFPRFEFNLSLLIGKKNNNHNNNKQIDVRFFYAFVLLLIMNLVITLSK